MASRPSSLRRPVFRGTVRVRTTVAVTLVVGFALSVAGIVLVTVLRESMVHDIQQVAELRAADLADRAASGPITLTIPADEDEIVQVVEGTTVVAASANAVGSEPLSLGRAIGSEPVAWTVTDPLALRGTFRVVALRVTAPSGRVVCVATSLKLADQTASVVRVSLLVGAPLLLVVVAAMTWLSVSRALRPVERIRSEVAEISSSDLARRLTPPQAHDEIKRLADTMNALLGRLQRSTDRQRRFVADASHELQSPLAAARSDLEVALAHPEQRPWPETASDLLAHCDGLQRLVGDLLFIARESEGAATAPLRPVDLHEVVYEEVAKLRLRPGLSCDISAVGVAIVAGRRSDLSRALRNLLDNAVQHAQSSVVVSLCAANGVVRLSVSDDGSGIPPDAWERVFERFARLDQARTRVAGGTGLGLAIVRDIAHRHGGRVDIEPTSRGAYFVLTLPAD